LYQVLAAACAHAQPVTGEIISHIYLPATQEPTAQHLRRLQLPDGFKIEKFASGLGAPRMLAVADDGTVYVTRTEAGDVLMLRDSNGDGKADKQKEVVKQPQVHGIAIHANKMYLATVKAVYVADMHEGGMLGELQTIINDLPIGGQHSNRTIAFGPDGMLYVTVGSPCDMCVPTDQKSATVLRVDPTSGQQTVFASGLRNTLGFGWQPTTKEMWGMDNGMDWLGDVRQGEELNHLVEGATYGWPYAYGAGNPTPQIQASSGANPKLIKQSRTPALLYTAHAAPIQMAFYNALQFPKQYINDAFVAMHGSWAREHPSGYEVVRIRFSNAGEAQSFKPFLRGFLTRSQDGTYAEFGRPTGVAVAKDGALLISDDTHGIIYRISYQGKDR